MIQTDVLIIGGGFAGVTVAQELAKHGLKTTLVDKKDYFEVTFATLRNVAAPDITDNSPRRKYSDFLSGSFIQSSVTAMSATSALLSGGTEIKFSHGVIASGTRYSSMPAAKSNTAIDIESRNSELQGFHQELKSANSVMVIGGGVVGVELAGEIAYAFPNKKLSLAHNSDTLLNGFEKKAQRKSLQQLKNLGVNVMLNSHYQKLNDGYVDQNTGLKCEADLIYEATGVRPNNGYLKENLSNILNEHGYVRVNERLEVIGQENLYALGDIADVGEPKLGYLAQSQGKYLAKSIIKKQKGKSAKGYKRNPLMALIPIGQIGGVVQLPFAVTTLRFLIGIKQKNLFVSKIYNEFTG